MSENSSISGTASVVVALLLVASAAAVVPAPVAAVDEAEPNDSRDTAQQVATGEEITGEVGSSDEDWFAFTVDRGETINVTMTATGDAENDVALYGPGGEYITNTFVVDGTASIGTTAQTAGTYYVEASPASGFNRGMEYTLTIDTSRTDPFEPNEDRENATRIDANATRTGEVSIGDEDWFAFTAERGETINVTMTAAGDAENDVALYDSSGDLITNTFVFDGTGSIGATVRTTGTYYVRASPASGFNRGLDYTLSVDTYRTDPFEPNENRTMATPLFENPFTPTDARLSVGDEDWFRYRLAAGETVRLEATASADSDDQELRVHAPEEDPANTTVLNPGNTEAVAWTARSSGVHELALVPQSGGTGDYEATVTVDGEPIGPPNDRFERPNPPLGNGDRANATELDPGLYADLGMVDDDRDVFAIDLDAGERVIADAAFDHDANDLALELASPSGATVASADSASDDERLAFTATSDGTHYLRVSGEAGSAATYDLDVTVLRRVDVTVGPGGETLEPGTTATFDVAVAGASAGLGAANLTLGSTNASVLAIQSVSAAGSGTADASVAADGGSATANVTGLDPAADGTVTLATVTVAAVENGSATLGGTAAVSSAGGLSYPVAGVQGTAVDVRVEPPAPDVTGDGNPARDPDGDGLYEDVNGDGDTTPGDATVLFNAVFEGNAAVTDNVGLFDFNGDGTVTPGDATVLFGEIF